MVLRIMLALSFIVLTVQKMDLKEPTDHLSHIFLSEIQEEEEDGGSEGDLVVV